MQGINIETIFFIYKQKSLVHCRRCPTAFDRHSKKCWTDFDATYFGFYIIEAAMTYVLEYLGNKHTADISMCKILVN